MDDEPYLENELTSDVTINEGSTPYAGAFFPSSQNLHVGGGVFSSSVANNTTNNIQQAAPSLPSDFRMITLGDIDLRKEIRVNYESGVVDRGGARRCVRKLYSAKIEDQKSTSTVKLYQGENAEQEWWEDLGKLSCIRHPNFVQIYGAASSQGVHAAIFQDDLIPFDDYLALYRHSPIVTVYIWGFCDGEFKDVFDYFMSVFGHWLESNGCQLFICRSTGRLCADVLEAGDVELFSLLTGNPQIPASENIMMFDGPNPDTTVISALTLEQYHHICALYLHNCRSFFPSAQATVRPGAIIDCSSDTGLEESVGIAFIRNPEVNLEDWYPHPNNASVSKTVIDGWTRYRACDVFSIDISTHISIHPHTLLTQANHIFTRLGITSNYDDYVFIHWITFALVIPANSEPAPPEGYLFVCPSEEFRIRPDLVQWPDCPAYWSLDASGSARLSMEEASELGFPDIELETQIGAYSWDASVYAGLRKFHQTKGFDPDSQDVARHLGLPLLCLSSEANIPFAHVDNTDSDVFNNDEASGYEGDQSERGLVSADEEDIEGSCASEPEESVGNDQDNSHELKSSRESLPISLVAHEPHDSLAHCGHHGSENQSPRVQDEVPAPELYPIRSGIWDLGVDLEDLTRWEKWLMLAKALLFTFLAVSWAHDHACA